MSITGFLLAVLLVAPFCALAFVGGWVGASAPAIMFIVLAMIGSDGYGGVK